MLAPQSAQAYDWKSWSGSTCQAFYGSQESRFNKTWSGINNVSSVASWVSCGIVTDRYVETDGTQGGYVWVTAPPGISTICYHSERTRSGAEVMTKVATRTGTGLIYIDTTASSSGGHRILACKLFPGVTLNQVYIWEYNPTDNNY